MTLMNPVQPRQAGGLVTPLVSPGAPVTRTSQGAPGTRTGLVRLRVDADDPHRRDLSPQELGVLRLIADGRTKDEISRRLGLSTSTVSRHMTRAYRALGARNAAHAVALAHASGLIARRPMPAAPFVSRRERQVLAGVAYGLTSEEVAERLSLSGETVKVHLRYIYRKLDVVCRASAVDTAINRRLLAVVLDDGARAAGPG